MGSFYTNITLRSADRDRVVSTLEALGRTAYVGPAEDGCTVVFDREAEDQSEANVRLAAELSKALGVPALAALVHDDDVLQLALCRGGEVIDTYDSAPGYFEGGAEGRPASGGDARLLAKVIGKGASAEAVEEILRAPWKESYLWETGRHADLAEALGLPDYAAGLGYNYVWEGDADEEVQGEMLHVGEEEEEDDDGGLAAGDADRMMRQMASFAQTLMGGPELYTLVSHPSARYFDALGNGDVEGVRALFAGEPRIDDPRFGRVEGGEALERFVAESAAWLREGAGGLMAELSALFGGAGAAAYQPQSLVQGGEREVAEGTLTFADPLPVATVWERAPEGGLGALRVYYTQWPLLGTHSVRPPVVEPAGEVEAPDVVGRYQAALAAGDVEGVLACFEEDGFAREPSGGEHVHFGREGLRAFYTALFSNGGGIPLGHCTLTDDGTRCAIEYVVTRWGRTDLPPQAGIAVYHRAPSGLLRAAHIYDDVEPPVGGA